MPEYLQLSSIAAVRELAELIAAAEWGPASYRGANGKYATEKIVLGIMHGAAVGLGPFAAIHAIAVIDGHPTIWGDGALALVERSGLIQDMREEYAVDGDEGLTAICTMRRRAWPTPISRCFSIAMAEEAGLTRKEGPWQTYPRRMLMMRARSWALRDGFADVLRGLSIREEVEDYDSLTASVPEPAFAKPPQQSTPKSHHGVPRPRFADYRARQVAVKPRTDVRRFHKDVELGQSPAAMVLEDVGSTEVAQETFVTLAAVPSAVSVDALAASLIDIPATTTEPQVSKAADEIVASLELLRQAKAEAIATPAVEQLAETTHELVDTDGSFIETDSLGSLREAFDRLFADPHLSADQVLGLWDSNETARHELARAFGEGALVEADRRREKAEWERRQHRRARIRRTTGRSAVPIAPPTGGASELNPPALDPSWSDDKLLQHYRSCLIALKLRRASAATFIAFREGNREIEERLRHQLPAVAAEIEAIYAWAALNAG